MPILSRPHERTAGLWKAPPPRGCGVMRCLIILNKDKFPCLTETYGEYRWPCPSWTTNRERGVVSGASRNKLGRNKLAQVVPTRIGAWVDLLGTQDKACSMSPMGSATWITIRGVWTPAQPCHLQDKVVVLGPAHWAPPSHFEVILKKWLMHNLVLSLPKSNENWSLTQSGKPLLGENKTVEIEISFLDGIEKNIEPSLHD